MKISLIHDIIYFKGDIIFEFKISIDQNKICDLKFEQPLSNISEVLEVCTNSQSKNIKFISNLVLCDKREHL